MLIGQVGATGMALAWIAVPHQQGAMTYAATAAALFLTHVAGCAYALGDSRMFYGSVLPSENSMNYTMVFYPCCQLMMGLGNLASGFLLDVLGNFHASIGPIQLDQYAPVFAFGALLAGLGAWILSFVRKDPPTLLKSGKHIAVDVPDDTNADKDAFSVTP